jgi:hypothetical protein
LCRLAFWWPLEYRVWETAAIFTGPGFASNTPPNHDLLLWESEGFEKVQPFTFPSTICFFMKIISELFHFSSFPPTKTLYISSNKRQIINPFPVLILKTQKENHALIKLAKQPKSKTL